MSPRQTISVVVPVHNEADYIPDALGEMFGELAEVDADIDVILAENGSTDGTADVAEAMTGAYAGLSVMRLEDPNYGAAMMAGFLAAGGDWRVNFDIDYFSGDFLNAVITEDTGADLILASKLAPGADDRRGLYRRLGTRVFNLILRLLFGSKVSDTHGMKAVRREVVEALVPKVRSTMDLFDTELVLRAERAGYRIVEVPATVVERRETAQGLAKRVPRTLLGLLRIRLYLMRQSRS